MMKAPTKVRKQTLAEQVEVGITELITQGHMEPGASLPSTAYLSQEFGVSRPVVREALRSLEARGLIIVQSGKKARVGPITSSLLYEYFERSLLQRTETVVELLEVRRGIEVQGALLAALRRTDQDVGELDAILTDMRGSLRDPDRYAEFDTQLHLKIVAASQNTMLFHLCESIRNLIKDTVREGLRSQARGTDIEKTQEAHVRLVETIRRGNSQEASLAMAEHLDQASARIVLRSGVSRERDSLVPRES